MTFSESRAQEGANPWKRAWFLFRCGVAETLIGLALDAYPPNSFEGRSLAEAISDHLVRVEEPL